MHLSDKQRKQAEMEIRHTIDHPFQATIDHRPEEQFFIKGEVCKNIKFNVSSSALSLSHINHQDSNILL